MKTLAKLLSRTFPAVALLLAAASCGPEGLTDTAAFSLYYPGVTDIGPSTTFKVTPTYHGAAPCDFEITSVTHEGEAFVSESFVIERETGTVHLVHTDNLPTGAYAVSVACVSDGRRYVFPDLIRITLLPAAPASIQVDPPVLQVKLADVVAGSPELPKARISTDGHHISIRKYLIAGVRLNGRPLSGTDRLFRISPEGEFRLIGGNEDFLPGRYVIDFRLTTLIAGEDAAEGLFPDALTVEVTSPPLALSYTPEEGTAEAGQEWKSAVPEYKGSPDDVAFALKEVSPPCPDLRIDARTGRLSLPAGNALRTGDGYTVSVTVANRYGARDFAGVYRIRVVDFIAPIVHFSYEDVGRLVEKVSFRLLPKEQDGDEVEYRFEDLPAGLGDLRIDRATGEISAASGHGLPLGTHRIAVKAENVKGAKTASFRLTVVANPNRFTHISWGNNLGLKPVAAYASQFRIWKREGLTQKIVESDLPETDSLRTFTLEDPDKSKNKVTVGEDGTLATAYNADRKVNFVIVVASVGTGEARITRKFPVFFDNMLGKGKKDMLEEDVAYTPFALKINPEKGGTSRPPIVLTARDRPDDDRLARLSIDFRRSFKYFNLDGPASHGNGQPKEKGSFLGQLWEKYYAPLPANTGARAPASYFENMADLTRPLCYFNHADAALHVNPNKFRNDDGPASGIFTAQATFLVTGKGADPQGSVNQIFPVAVWFDPDF